MAEQYPDADTHTYIRRHLRFGWCSLACFICLGIALELMHGFKLMWYLDAENETRRLMWTLAHAHGTLVSLVHVALSATLSAAPWLGTRLRPVASTCLILATFFLPGGFFLGGIVIYEGDPGLGILLVPVGALSLLAGVVLIASQTFTKPTPPSSRQTINENEMSKTQKKNRQP